MEEVQEGVEKLMSKHLKNGMAKQGRKSKRTKFVVSSSSSSQGSESSDSESSICSDHSCRSEKSDEERSKKSRHHRRSRDEIRAEEKLKRRSGKSRKMTSHVRYPQEWPHSYLSLHFVSNDRKYEDLSLEEFCAGYASIPEGIKDRKLQKYRIQHLKELI